MPAADLDQRPRRGRPDAVARPACARSFGNRAEDLEMDFSRLGSPELVSALLHACLRGSDGAECSLDEIWSWNLPTRLQGLLALAAASGIASLTAATHCRQCPERYEIEVDIGKFARHAETEDALAFDCSPQAEHRLSLRLPTGLDQLNWLAAAEASAEIMARDLVLSVNGESPPPQWRLPAAWVDTLAAQMEQHDPLTALELHTRCPACDAEAALEFDLEGHLLARLRALQLQMVRETHLLAMAYHWSEADIVRLPAWRRRYYLAQIGSGDVT